jgi:hypothetical protein
VLFGSQHSPLYGELLIETCYINEQIKYQYILISSNLYLFTYKLRVFVIVNLHLWIGSDTLIMSLYTFRLSKPCILHS